MVLLPDRVTRSSVIVRGSLMRHSGIVLIAGPEAVPTSRTVLPQVSFTSICLLLTSHSTESVPEVSIIRFPAAASISNVPFVGIGHFARRAGGNSRKDKTSADAADFGNLEV